jgi:hypothetical protein
MTNSGLVTRESNRDWPYVAVREVQERGALHMHIACVGKQDLPLIRACWYVALGGSEFDGGENVLGQIDVQSQKRRFSGKPKCIRPSNSKSPYAGLFFCMVCSVLFKEEILLKMN